jgi:hypothetical protein
LVIETRPFKIALLEEIQIMGTAGSREPHHDSDGNAYIEAWNDDVVVCSKLVEVCRHFERAEGPMEKD